jgi:hypothetical protein
MESKYILLALSLNTIPVFAVEGNIIDFWGRPIEGVSVNWCGTNKATTTNSSGEFSLDSSGTTGIYAVRNYDNADNSATKIVSHFDLLGRHVGNEKFAYTNFSHKQAPLYKTTSVCNTQTSITVSITGFAPETLAVAGVDSVPNIVLRHYPEIVNKAYEEAIFTSFRTTSLSAKLDSAQWTQYHWGDGATFGLVWDADRNDSVLYIKNSTSNHTHYSHIVCNLLPTRHYLFHGAWKGSNVVNNEEKVFGVTLGSWNDRNDYRFSQKVNSMGTHDWHIDTAIVEAGNDGCVDLHLALGNRYNISTGEAWFDDLQLDGPLYAVAAPGFIVHVEEKQKELIDSATLYLWAKTMGEMVARYVNLAGPASNIVVGETPSLAPSHEFSTGLVSGNPFLFGYLSYEDVLINHIKPFNDLTFGSLHEMGHNFGISYWGFAGEMQANLLGALVMDSLPHTVVSQESWGGQYYVGWGNEDYPPEPLDTAAPALLTGTGDDMNLNPPVALIHLFKASHDQYINGGSLNWDAIQYKFMLMVLDSRIGWEAFHKALWKMRTETVIPTTNQAKFDAFLVALHTASQGTWSNSEFFTDAELLWVETSLQ